MKDTDNDSSMESIFVNLEFGVRFGFSKGFYWCMIGTIILGVDSHAVYLLCKT
jgi:hypothetical protein